MYKPGKARALSFLFFSNHVIQNWTEHWQEYDSDDPEDFLLRVFGTLNDIHDHDNVNNEDYKVKKLSHNTLVRLKYFEELVKIWSNDDLCSSILLFVLRGIVCCQRRILPSSGRCDLAG